MIYYKIVDKNLRGYGKFQFQIGKRYKKCNISDHGTIRSHNVFHFCRNILSCISYASVEDFRILRIKAYGKVYRDYDLYAAKEIEILDEITIDYYLRYRKYFMSKYNYGKLIKYINIPEYLIEFGIKYKNIDLKDIICHQKLSDDFIEKHLYEIIESNYMDLLLVEQNFDQQRYYKFYNDLIQYCSMDHLIEFIKFDEQTIISFIDNGYDNFKNILAYQNVSEKFIEKLKEKLA